MTRDASHSTLPAAVPAPVPSHELACLAQGFALVFWGTFALLAAAIEVMLAPTLRLFPALVGAGGAAGVSRGACWLLATPHLGRAWQCRVRGLVVSGGLIAYLTPFVWMWRQAPTNRYLFCHALAWFGAFIVYLVLANECVRTFGRAGRHRSLVIQAALFGLATVLVLFVPFLIVAAVLVRLTWGGRDPLEALLFSLEHLHPQIVFVLLAPVSLTLSLVWAAKDLALERLTIPPVTPMLESTRQ